MKVYHGSYTEIKAVDLSQCEPYKDFGKGFYVKNLRNKRSFGQTEKVFLIKIKVLFLNLILFLTN